MELLHGGKLGPAQLLLKELCETNPNDAEAWYWLGAIYQHLNETSEAKKCYTHVVNLQPQRPDIHYYLGNIYLELNQLIEAEACYQRSIALKPDYVEAHNNLGFTFERQKKYDQAAECYKSALRIDSRRAELHFNLGNMLKELEQYREAEASYRRSLELKPDQVDAYNNLGNVLAYQRHFDEAATCYQRALELKPDQVDAYNNLGDLLADQGRFDEAIAFLQQTILTHPNHPDLHHNLGSILHDCGRVREAIKHYDKAITLNPDFVEAHWNRSMALLLIGDFQRGWADYEWKWKRTGKSRPLTPSPWDGSNLNGRSVFLHAEQGLGDELFFLRFAVELKRRNAGTINYRAGSKIASLLSRVPFIDRISAPEDIPTPEDLILSVGDLPRILAGTALTQTPPPLGLTPLPEKLTAMRAQLAVLGKPPYVGLTWRAGTKVENSRKRTLYKECPIPLLASTIKGFPATILVLQRNPVAGDIEMFTKTLGRPVHDFSSLNEDLEAMLALLALLDDYVGVSNTNMHLHAGLGKTARVLVPMPADWRWMAGGRESPWFPGFSVYRQNYDGSWDDAFTELAADLKSLN